MSRTARRLAPPRAYTREDICREALALVDEEGLEALTMRRLGARLGIEAMSLYHHVRDKADLLDALHAAVLGRLQPEEPDAPRRQVRPDAGADARRGRRSGRGAAGDDWRMLLGGLARALRSTLLAHPNVLPLFTRRPVRAPEALGTLERVHAAMAAAGFSEEAILNGVYVVGMFTIGHVIFEADKPDEAHRGPRREVTFRLGLEALLDGVARGRTRKTRRRS